MLLILLRLRQILLHMHIQCPSLGAASAKNHEGDPAYDRWEALCRSVWQESLGCFSCKLYCGDILYSALLRGFYCAGNDKHRSKAWL